VGKKALPPSEAVGEYIGLARLGARGAAIVGNTLDKLALDFAGREEEPFQRAARYRNAYQTDLWQQLIDTGIRIDPVFIDGQWREIDTGQDLARARELLLSRPKEWS
jgi:choline kinase